MPYFFILPIYLAVLPVLIVLFFLSKKSAKWQFASTYIFWGTIGSFIGFIVSNVGIIFVGILPLWISQQISLEWLRTILQLIAAAILFLGPFGATAIGVIFGSAVGLLFAFYRKHKAL